MCANQREPGRCMVEAGSPCHRIHAVTVGTFDRETGGTMAWICGLIVLRSMTPDARGRGTEVLVAGALRVTGTTIGCRMVANQRKACLLMALDHVGDSPGLE